MKNAGQFFDFAKEREKIRERKESGEQFPWTDDHILRQYRFCNVHREDDRVTIWFRENIRDVVRDDPVKSLMACVVFRWFNTVAAGEALKPALLHGWDVNLAQSNLWAAKRRGEKIFTGAYMLKSPKGVDKISGLLDCIQNVWHGCTYGHRGDWGVSLESMHKWLMQFPFLGRFMSYEVVTDLRHTCVLEGAPDVSTWASAGPGAARGLGWLLYDDPTVFNYVSKSQEGRMLGYVRSLLALSRDPRNWRWDQRSWEMRTVEHVLCEFAKYKSAHAGQKLKRRYKPC